ncbi:hypothetical protein [Croceivirga thetidis]|uniref:Uncharacterized protein n=1 Tax=Croceivirga thetidis TaxID=2721623 RepID=A0ABX1GU14_9FLAO|nr:hypothetical protein [Croceivirga thetidis]NKI33443.1 hypothetical protein [Croceivirga thetidis]
MKIDKILLLLFICILSACKPEKGNRENKPIPKEITALEVVENAIKKAGTLEKWKRMASLEYTKKSKLILENGQIESDITQRHHYQFRPEKNIKISWVTEKDSFLIVHNDTISQKFKNGKLIEEGDKVKSTVNSALYVIGMPFKLLDKGTKLNYEGLTSLNGIDTVHTITATYAPNKFQNHSTQDDWWYYFDKNNWAFIGSKVYHEPTYALIENMSMIAKEGLIFPATRKSYRCKESGEKVFLRAEFWYSDYEIEFLEE